MSNADEVRVLSFGWVEIRALVVQAPIGRPGEQTAVSLDLSIFRPIAAAVEADKPADTLGLDEICSLARNHCQGSFETIEAFAAGLGQAIFAADNSARRVKVTALAQTPEAGLPVAGAGITIELQKGDGRPPWTGDRRPERGGGRGDSRGGGRGDGRGGGRGDGRGGGRGDGRGGGRGDSRGGGGGRGGPSRPRRD